ncbi:hypothetical protein BB559_000708 [Furculomyces boomerangus]|uniref:DNA primase large subunit n=2 Tax=Harpellales TaxID=61421 RepID=A0A2T9Z4J8_9FUNG|nr:hypothetical protein BB559_000708 [Furculomyces boomerangus]PWA02743.1 hypothetical protein BB558_001117 [Smittium angustum]
MYSQVKSKNTDPISNSIKTSLEQILQTPYPGRLSLYEKSPDLEISIEEFEIFALDRLKVLKEVELAYIRGPTTEQIQKRIIEVSTKYLPLSGRKHKPINVLVSERRKDYVSHFILRLSFSRTEELRSWFVKQESNLFKARFMNFDKEDQELLFTAANMDLRSISESEAKELDAKTAGYCGVDNFYEVDFEKALDLVYKRKVVLIAGKAYVPRSEITSLLVEEYRTRLNDSTIVCGRALPRLEGDDRLLPVLQNMSAQYAVTEYQSSGAAGEINHTDIDKLSKYFPPCMLNLHTKLRENSHLRHGGRMQYGLFIKGIGLKLPEALTFWRQAFSKTVSEDKFNKEYAYNIRHSFGLEGKRQNYTPFSCSKIISSNPPSTGDYHGCPFKHFAPNRLNQYLGAVCESGGAGSDMETGRKISEIVQLAKQNHYQVACTRFLELQISNRLNAKSNNSKGAMSGIPNNDLISGNAESSIVVEGISHPNSYFDLNFGNGKIIPKDQKQKVQV